MEAGTKAEYDHPYKLLAENDGDKEINKKTEDG